MTVAELKQLRPAHRTVTSVSRLIALEPCSAVGSKILASSMAAPLYFNLTTVRPRLTSLRPILAC